MTGESRKDVNFAVVGCGLMGQRHVDVIRATPGARLTAVWDRHRELAEKACPAEGVRIASGYEDLLESDDVDAIVLCLPSGLHAEYGIRAVQAGRHVVTEKPIDINIAEGRRLADEAQKAGVVCAVISQNRFAEGPAAVKAALERGDLGRPVLVEASVKWFRHDEYYTKSDWRGRINGEGGGVVMNQAIHTIDLLLWMFGEPESVQGITSINRPAIMETEDTGVAVLRFPNGVLATLAASTSTFPGFEERIAIHGPTSACVLESGKITFWKHAEELAQPVPPSFEAPTEGLSPKLTLFQRQYRNILDAIAGRAALVVTPDESVATLAAARAIYGEVYAEASR